jgi:hypothetical protein
MGSSAWSSATSPPNSVILLRWPRGISCRILFKKKLCRSSFLIFVIRRSHNHPEYDLYTQDVTQLSPRDLQRYHRPGPPYPKHGSTCDNLSHRKSASHLIIRDRPAQGEFPSPHTSLPSQPFRCTYSTTRRGLSKIH